MGSDSLSKLLILGAGGHGRVVADCAMETGIYEKIAFLDDEKSGKKVLGFPVIGKIKDFETLTREYRNAFVAIGNNRLRVKLIEELYKLGYQVPILIHPKAHVSRFSLLQYGTAVLAGAIVSAGAALGIGSIINTCASVDHDCVLGRGVHISPGARLGGSVIVGDYTWICIGASVANNISIGENSIIAAGAAVVEEVRDEVMAAGVPAVVKKSLRHKVLNEITA